MVNVNAENMKMKALCVARHEYLASHFARFFASPGLETMPAVGLADALHQSRGFWPDVVICEYELLSMLPLDVWEQHELLSRTAVIAVSLTRRPTETQLLDANGLSGFLYLPLLDADAALTIITAAAESSRRRYVTTSEAASPAGTISQATLAG